MNNLTNITEEFEGQKVGFRINKTTGQSEVRINEIAKFCGWTRVASSGNESVRWERVNYFLEELSCPQVGTGDFIPEYIMYPLIGKAKNERATQFMLWVGKVLTEIRTNGGYISNNATPKQVENLNSKWAKQSIYLTNEIHDRKSIRKFIRDYDKMQLDECIDTIAEMTNKMKGSIKHDLLDVAIKELKAIDDRLMKDTIKNTYIKDTASVGIITLQDVKIGKFKKRIKALEQVS